VLPNRSGLAEVRATGARLSAAEIIRVNALECRRRLRAAFDAHYIQHLWTAHASGAELETQVEVGNRLELFNPQQAEVLIRDAQEIGRMINGLVRSLERSEHQRSR
jgi:four helix bundle protein